MTVIYKYRRKGFFGNFEYSEDKIICCCPQTAYQAILKAIRAMMKTNDTAIEVSDYDGNKTIIIWAEYDEREIGIVTVRKFDIDKYLGYEEKKMSRQAMTNMMRDLCKSIAK